MPTRGIPRLIVVAGQSAALHGVIEFFTAEIRNPNTRRAYHTVLGWTTRGDPAGAHGRLRRAVPGEGSEAARKKPCLAVRMFFDYLVVGQIVAFNPASSVRGLKYVTNWTRIPVFVVGRGAGPPGLDHCRESREAQGRH